MEVSTAATIQVRIISPGDCVCRAISAETMKMPEPIMEPMTSVVASIRPRPLIRPVGVGLLIRWPIVRR